MPPNTIYPEAVSEIISLRLTPTQLKTLEAAAFDAGGTVPTYLRAIIDEMGKNPMFIPFQFKLDVPKSEPNITDTHLD